MYIKSLKTYKYFFHHYPTITILTFSFLFLAGIIEGVGIITLLPLIAILSNDVTSGYSEQNPNASKIITEIFNFLSINPSLTNLIAFIVGIMLVKLILLLISQHIVARTVAHVTRDLRGKILEALTKSKWAFFSGHPVGTSVNSIVNETIRAGASYQTLCLTIANLLQVFIYMYLAFLVASPVVIGTAVIGLLALVFLKPVLSGSYRAGYSQTELLKTFTSRIVEFLNSIKSIKSMAQESLILKTLRPEMIGLEKAQYNQSFLMQFLGSIQEFIIISCIAIGLLVLSYTEIGFETIIFMAALFYRLIAKINNAYSSYQGQLHQESALWSLQDLLNTLEENKETYIPSSNNKSYLKELLMNNSIKFRNVTFRHGEKTILHKSTFTFPKKGIVSIYGSSGIGKTSTIDLVVRLYDPTGGEILLGKTKISSISKDEWRSEIGYVPQEIILLNDSVIQNVKFGRENISEKDVVNSLEKAQAFTFIKDLKENLGERGGRISGGEKQRIAIARALAGNPSILIFDEPTSALDKKNESKLMDIIKSFSSEKLIIIVTHNEFVLKSSDVKITIKNKKLVADSKQPN